MAVREIHVDAPPARVFEILASGDRYAEWVVGAKNIRAVDDGWPQCGSKLHHTVGVGPFTIADTTKVIEVDPPRRIVLEARARPVGRARVELVIDGEGLGSRVRMVEDVISAPPIVRRLLEPAIGSRNADALRRLRDLCEREGP